MNRALIETASREELNAIVKTLPIEQRGPFNDLAAAAMKRLKKSQGDYDRAFNIATAIMVNWWHIGEVLPQMVETGQPKKNGIKLCHTLASLGVSKNQSVWAQKLRRTHQTEAELQESLQSVYDRDRYHLPSLFSSKVHVTNNSGNHEWYTPPEIIERARKVLGSIDLDPASNETAQQWIQAGQFYTAKDNGLDHQWSGRVWLNPPYSKGLCELFSQKFCSEPIDAGCMLVNNATDSAWFQNIFRNVSAICFLAGRLKYVTPDGEPGNSPLQGQAIAYRGRAKKRFADTFADAGFVVMTGANHG